MSNLIHLFSLSFASFSLLACGAISDKLGGKETAPQAAASDPAPTAPSPPKASSPTTSEGEGPRDATHEEFKAYHALVASHRDALLVIADVKAGKLSIHPEPAKAGRRLDDLKTKMSALGSFASACDDYRSLRIMDLKAWQKPDVACDNAKQTGAVLKTLAQYAADRYVKSRVEAFDFQFETLAKGHGLSNKALKALLAFDVATERDKARTAIGPLEVHGASVDVDAVIGDVSDKRDKAFADAPAASKKFRYTKRTSGAITKATKTPFASMKKFKVKKTLAAGDWIIHKNRSGVPSFRKQRTQVVGKLAKEPFCRLYEVELSQSYAGGGRWAKPVRSGVIGAIRITSCR